MIKVSTLRSVLHEQEGLSLRDNEFIKNIENELNEKIEVSDISDYNCDLKLIFIETGGSEMLFKNAIDKLQEPFYFLTTGENNSLAATLEILTYLNEIGKKGEVLHGSVSYIASRIKELKDNKKVDLIKGQRFGVIGKPSDWLISSIPNKEKLENKFGIELIDIPLEKVINEYKDEEVKENFDDLGFDRNEVKNALKVNNILNRIVEDYKLNGLTIRCFDLLDTIKTTGCLALAKLNQKGIIATCEGDIMAMISMAISKAISNQSSFQANPSKIDIENNTVLFAHCTIPLDMLNSYKYKTHFESGIGVAIKGEVKEEEVTVLRLSADLSHYFVSSGKIISNLNKENLCRTQILVKLDKPVKELLTNPCGNHHIIFFGNYEKEIDEIFK